MNRKDSSVPQPGRLLALTPLGPVTDYTMDAS